MPDGRTVKLIGRDAFLYEPPRQPVDKFAQCATCVFFAGPGCPAIGDKTVKATDSCGLYCHGKPGSARPAKPSATPKEAGLVHRPVRCENCDYFKRPGHCGLYAKLNRDEPGIFDLDERVHPKACCNAQTGLPRQRRAAGGRLHLAEGGSADDADEAAPSLLGAIRQRYPQYSDLSDQQLGDGFYRKFYSDMPRAEFDAKLAASAPVGAFRAPPEKPAVPAQPFEPNAFDRYEGRIAEAGAAPFRRAWNAPIGGEKPEGMPDALWSVLKGTQRAIDLGMAVPESLIGSAAARLGLDPDKTNEWINEYLPSIVGAEGGPHLPEEAPARGAAAPRTEPPPLAAAPSTATDALKNIAEGKPAGAPRTEPPPLDTGTGAPPPPPPPGAPPAAAAPGPLGDMGALDRLKQLAGLPPETRTPAPKPEAAISQTSAEPASDIRAQVRAMLDPAHPKDAVFAAKANLGDLPPDLPANVERVETPEGTLLTTDPEKAQAFRADPSDDTLARVLGYPQSKADVLARMWQGDDPVVVQARDREGNVIAESLASTSRADEARQALEPQAGPGGAVHVLDPREVQALRQQRATAAPPQAAQIQGEAATPQPQQPPIGAAPPITPPLAMRPIKPAEAVTSTGRSLPVQYAIVDARDLVTSHTDDLTENPAYPQGVQPRDRTRGATELQMSDMLNPQKFRPELLGESPDAANGAPIVGPDGVVESGNMRSMALRRAYDRGLPAAEAYRDYLARQGYPVEGVEQPVLVRVNHAAMEPAEREAFAREANKPAQLAMSATERAMADAKALPDHVMDQARPEDLMSAGNRGFVRDVLRAVASQAEMGALVGKDGALSAEGLQRVRGAVLAKAYGDPGIIATLLESTDGNYRAIGNALLEAAPGWAKMRAAAATGQIPPEFDVTPNLVEAVNVISHARATGRNVAEFVKQTDLLSGGAALDPRTEEILKWMLRGADFGRAVGREKVADALHFYAREALKVEPGESMFGDKTTPQQLIEGARVRAQGREGPETPSLAFREGMAQPGAAGTLRPGARPFGPEEPGRGAGAAGQRQYPGGQGQPVGFEAAAYHGSPHIFDRFDTSKIGTGEGAQAYGHGLYFASRKGVAQYYREQLSEPGRGPHADVDYLSYLTKVAPEGAAGDVRKYADANQVISRAETAAHQAAREPSVDSDGSLTERTALKLREQAELARKDSARIKGPMAAVRAGEAAYYDGAARAVESGDIKLGYNRGANKGRLYHVEIAPTNDELLDWDKPIKDQSEKVKEAIRPLYEGRLRRVPLSANLDDIRLGPAGFSALKATDERTSRAIATIGSVPKDAKIDDLTKWAIDHDPRSGQAIYAEAIKQAVEKGMVAPDGNPQAGGSNLLLDHGVRGIRYLDQGSRGAGEGSHNYVIFNDRDVSVTGFENRDLFDKTEQGDQRVIPGAEKASPEQVAAHQRQQQKAEAELRMQGRKGTQRAQEAADSAPLFGGKGTQGTLFEPGRDERTGDLFGARPPSGPPEPIRPPDAARTFQQRPNDFARFRQDAGQSDKTPAGQQQAARAYVLDRGAKDGKEHLVAYDTRGNAIATSGTSNLPAFVKLPPELMARAADAREAIDIHHNHPSGTPTSTTDAAMLGMLGLRWVAAHAAKGDIAAARLMPAVRAALTARARTWEENFLALKGIHDTAGRAIAAEMQAEILAGRLPIGLANHWLQEITNRAVAHAGVTDYVTSHLLPPDPRIDRWQAMADPAVRRAALSEFPELQGHVLYRPTRPVRPEEGMARLSQGDARDTGPGRGGAGGDQGGRGNAGPRQGRLLEGFAEDAGGFEEPEEESRLGRLFARIPRAERFAEHARSLLDIGHSIQMALTPMARGSIEARAVAKDFANAMRLSRFEWNKVDDWLKANFTPEQLARMWSAADEESVARQTGAPIAGIGLSRLAPEERAAVEALQGRARAAFETARDMGMVEGEGLPSYAPRMVVDMGEGYAQRLKAPETGTGNPLYGGKGRNLRTTTPQLRGRKHLTAEETEAAAQSKFGAGATVVRDIRTLSLATAKLQDAIAGKGLIEAVKDAGRRMGEETVHEGAEPAGSDHRWFTLDHPAFKVTRPRFTTDPETGKVVPVKDADGNPVFDRVPLYIRDDFEGPLKAVLSQDHGAVYNALMALKGKTMSVVMYSPLIHNAVEWGRALPAMPGKVATFRVYFEGNRFKNDAASMREAINAGMVPIGHRGGMQDISSMMAEPTIKPGRSWTAQLLGAIPGLFDARAGDAVKRSVDRMGDFWHNTLLWDRVGDLQAGLYKGLRDHLIDKGNDPETAQRMAAHFANRYAGALPQEAMSTAARKIANLALFSRTFTLGNLGAMKDVLTGLPRDVQAQIIRDRGELVAKGARSIAARKAAATLMLDVGLMYVGNSILQSAVSVLSGNQSPSGEAQGYARRLLAEFQHLEENPIDLLNPFGVASSLTPMAENEPGKEDRVKVGHADDGTAIYMRNPTGKIGEEFKGWLTGPLDMLHRKLGTLARPLSELVANDKGFGRKVYDPDASTPADWAKNIGRIVTLFIGDQVPLQSVQAANDYFHGRGDATVDATQVLGPLLGLTFSKGAPGGEARGELFRARDEHEFKVQEAMPGIRQAIKGGDVDGARARMTALGIPPKLQDFYIRSTLNPGMAVSRRQMRDFMGYATPEQRERFERAKGNEP